ncbi:ATP-binding protein [Thermodesulfovibrio hydrogeniphilus]
MDRESIETYSLLPRDKYIEYIKKYLGTPVIKVLVGMRRAGKSSLIKLLINDLVLQDVPLENIVYINKESLEFEDIKTYKDLYSFVSGKLKELRGQKFIFIDEIQEIEAWEKAVVSFLAESLGDIIITGSNSHLLSSELATLITGRYIEIFVYPLSFKEFLYFRGKTGNIEDEFKNYLKFGGLPGIHHLLFEEEVIFNYLNSVLSTILYKDVIVKNKIRDVALFDKTVRYIFDNIANVTTAKRIADYFKSQKIKASIDTILNYLKYLENALLIHKVPRYDLKGKKYLEFYDKIFLNDIGLRNGLIGYIEKDINAVLENIVYLHLKTNGYVVSIGKLNGMEIDFIAQRQNETKYIQVAYLLTDDKVIKREFENLLSIPDNYEKIVISMDKFFVKDIKGIKHKYILDFLLEEI